MANEKLPEVIEFKDLVKSIFVSLKAAEEALGLKAKTFSRLSKQKNDKNDEVYKKRINEEIAKYKAIIENFVKENLPYFDINDYTKAHKFYRHYQRNITDLFRFNKKKYKGNENLFITNLLKRFDAKTITDDFPLFGNKNDPDIIYFQPLEGCDIYKIKEIKYKYNTLGINIQIWISSILSAITSNEQKNKANKTKAIDEAFSPTFILANELYMFNPQAFIYTSSSFLPTERSLTNWTLIKKEFDNQFKIDEITGIYFPYAEDNNYGIELGITFFGKRDKNDESWDIICDYDTCIYKKEELLLFEKDENGQQYMHSYHFTDNEYKYSYTELSTNKRFFLNEFSELFYLLPKEECVNSELVDLIFFNNILNSYYWRNWLEQKKIHVDSNLI